MEGKPAYSMTAALNSAGYLREAVRDASGDGLAAVELGVGPNVQHLVATGLLPGRHASAEQMHLT